MDSSVKIVSLIIRSKQNKNEVTKRVKLIPLKTDILRKKNLIKIYLESMHSRKNQFSR